MFCGYNNLGSFEQIPLGNRLSYSDGGGNASHRWTNATDIDAIWLDINLDYEDSLRPTHAYSRSLNVSVLPKDVIEDCALCPDDCGTCGCVPDCDAKTCGDDGCGRSCGACELGAQCVSGVCESSGCEGLLQEGLITLHLSDLSGDKASFEDATLVFDAERPQAPNITTTGTITLGLILGAPMACHPDHAGYRARRSRTRRPRGRLRIYGRCQPASNQSSSRRYDLPDGSIAEEHASSKATGLRSSSGCKTGQATPATPFKSPTLSR